MMYGSYSGPNMDVTHIFVDTSFVCLFFAEDLFVISCSIWVSLLRRFRCGGVVIRLVTDVEHLYVVLQWFGFICCFVKNITIICYNTLIKNSEHFSTVFAKHLPQQSLY